MARDPLTTAPGRTRSRVAVLSVASNTALIALKLAAAVITGSVALLTEALHSAIDLVASVVAYFSLRKAEEPADDDHPYGHDKLEDLAAVVEGVLILVGSMAITFEAARHLASGATIDHVPVALVVLAISISVNLVVTRRLRRTAAETGSPALTADASHLTADALTSATVFVGLALVGATGATWLDPVVALVVAALILVQGIRIVRRGSRSLIDEALPEPELECVRDAILEHGPPVAGFHALRARRAGAARHIDVHVQFEHGTTLEEAHVATGILKRRIAVGLGGTVHVLIHIEPEDAHEPVPAAPVADVDSL